MPCTYYTSKEEAEMAAQEVGKLNVLLCEAYGIIEEAGLDKQCSKELKAFAKRHEAKEVERVAREGLAKLTRKERRALGLEK